MITLNLGGRLLEWHLTRPEAIDAMGYIPLWIDPDNPDHITKQLGDNYAHGGGWHSFSGFTVSNDGKTITYPGDPPLHAFAWARLREEQVFIFPGPWVLVLNDNGRADIARMD